MASATENRFINLYINGKQAGKTLTQIRANYRKLSAEINRGELSQKEYNAKVKELAKYGAILKEHQNKVRGVSKSWSTLKSVAVGVLGGNLILGAFQKLTQFIPEMIGANAKLADSFSDIQKTTDLTDKGVEDLSQRLKTIDTRTPRARLRELAVDAGKLGIKGVDNLHQFVKAADQIEVSLSEDMGEGAIKSLGKLNNLFKVSDVYGYEQGLLKLGSVINELGANSEANEGNIVDFTNRLAGVADQANISFESIAAIGSTLDSLGQRVETSGTAITQTIVGMFKDTPTYAKIAGKSIEEFSGLLETDANEAFLQFLEGLNGNNEGLGELTKKFDKLGIDGSRAITVLGALSGNTQKLREQQTLANKAFAEGTSLTQEFSRKNENAAANIEKISRAVNALWVNSSIKSAIDAITSSLSEMVEVPVSENLEMQRNRFNGLMAALIDTNTVEEDRIGIIKQLQESYGERLGNLDLEKASLAELQQVMGQVNEQYIIEIALMTQRERIKELAEQKGKTESRRLDNTIDANAQLIKTNEKLGTSYETVAEAVEDLQNKTASANRVGAITFETKELAKLMPLLGGMNIAKVQATKIGEELAEQQKRELSMVEQLKKDYPELGDVIDKTYAKINGVATGGALPGKTAPKKNFAPTTDGEVDAKAQKEAEKLISAEQTKYEKLLETILKEEEKIAIAKLDGKAKQELEIQLYYDKMADLAEGHTDELVKIETMRWEALKALDAEEAAKYIEDKKAAEEQIAAALAPEGTEDPEIVAVREKYRLLIEMAELYKLDTVAITQAMNDALADLEAESSQEMLRLKAGMLNQGLGTIASLTDDANTRQMRKLRKAYDAEVAAAGDNQDAINGIKEKYNKIAGERTEKSLKFQKGAALTQIAIDTAVALSSSIKAAAAIPWPANLAAIATSVGSILAFIGSASKILSQAPEPPAFADGTDYFEGGRARINETKKAGEIVTLPGGSAILPAGISQQLLAANAFSRPTPQPNFSTINRGLTHSQGQQAQRSGSNGGGGGNMDLGPLLQRMDTLISTTQQAQDKEVKLSYQTFMKFQKEVDQAEKNVMVKR